MTSSLARSRLYRSSGHWRNKSKQGSCTVLGVGAAKAACPIRNVGGWRRRWGSLPRFIFCSSLGELPCISSAAMRAGRRPRSAMRGMGRPFSPISD